MILVNQFYYIHRWLKIRRKPVPSEITSFNEVISNPSAKALQTKVPEPSTSTSTSTPTSVPKMVTVYTHYPNALVQSSASEKIQNRISGFREIAEERVRLREAAIEFIDLTSPTNVGDNASEEAQVHTADKHADEQKDSSEEMDIDSQPIVIKEEPLEDVVDMEQHVKQEPEEPEPEEPEDTSETPATQNLPAMIEDVIDGLAPNEMSSLFSEEN